MSEIYSERSEMSSSVEAAKLMREIAGPSEPGAHIETLIRGVARKVDLSYARAKALWYREARVVRAEEMDALRATAQRDGGAEIDLQRKYRDVSARVERLERLLAASLENAGRPRDGARG